MQKNFHRESTNWEKHEKNALSFFVFSIFRVFVITIGIWQD